MKIVTVPTQKLTVEHLRAWRELQRRDPALFSPFLAPEFTIAVGAVREDVEVAVAEEKGRLVGFLPFQRSRWNVGYPVGAGLNEFQAAIVQPKTPWRLDDWVRQCGLVCWNFDHLVPAQSRRLSQHHQILGDSPYMDLSRGFQHFERSRRDAGSLVIANTQRKIRKLERDIGPVQFLLHDSSDMLFGRLLSWKSAQHQRTGVLDVFRFDWVVNLLRQIRNTRTEGFRGEFSVLLAGDQPMAVHLGLRTNRAGHLWYPAYDPQFAKYSPGMILFLELAKALAYEGVERLDLGPGPQRYKRSLMTHATTVARGTVDCLGPARFVRKGWNRAKQWVRRSPLRRAVRMPANLAFQFRRWMAFRT